MAGLTTFGIHELGLTLAATAVVLIIAVAAVRLSERTGLPSLLLYMLIGVALAEAGLGLEHDQLPLSRVLGYTALILILGEGGLTTSWDDIRRSVAPAAWLSTLGVLVSVVVVGAAARLVLQVDWTVGLLLGAILASTDAAAVFSVLRQVPLPARLSGLLEAESGFNDAPAVLLVVTLSAQATPGLEPAPVWLLALLIVAELAGGAVVGILIGWVGAWFMTRMTSTAAGLFPIGVFAWVPLAYGVATILHVSGFLAAYIAALLLGNAKLPHRAAYRGFAQGLGWFAQIGLFVMIGLLASPADLLTQLWPAVLLGLVLLLIARPLSVYLCTLWFRIPWRDQLFLSWAGLRGAVPIVLATVPMIVGVPNITWLFNLVFVLVVVFTLVQGPTLPWVARRLGVTADDRPLDLNVDSTPLEELGVDLLEVTIGQRSRLHGVELFELRLPPGAEVSLIVRDGAAFVPGKHSSLRRGDQLLIVSTMQARARARRQLHAINAEGRLAGWGPASSSGGKRAAVVRHEPLSPRWGGKRLPSRTDPGTHQSHQGQQSQQSSQSGQPQQPGQPGSSSQSGQPQQPGQPGSSSQSGQSQH